LSFGDGPRGALALLMVAPWYVLLSQASQAVSRLVTHEAPTTIKHETLQRLSEHTMDAWSWLTIAGAVIGAPIFEELAYRVFIQAAVLRVTRAAGQGWAAVAITSAVWTMVHLGAVPPSALPSLFLLGLGMGIAYERTQRLGVPIAMHMLFNAINVIAVATGLVK
jgi:membrane protease YdiL (CAAX protease family)